MPQYGSIEYWTDRYKARDEEHFDWYMSLRHFKQLLQEQLMLIGPGIKILDAGCGNSRLSMELYYEGFRNVIGIDAVPFVIQKMKAQYPEHKYMKMDICSMDFADESFDIIIDKATLDSLMCNADSGRSVAMYMKEAARVLKKGGVMFVFSYGYPETRLPIFNKPYLHWEVQVSTLEKPSIGSEVSTSSGASSAKAGEDDPFGFFYVYTLCKTENATTEELMNAKFDSDSDSEDAPEEAREAGEGSEAEEGEDDYDADNTEQRESSILFTNNGSTAEV